MIFISTRRPDNIVRYWVPFYFFFLDEKKKIIIMKILKGDAKWDEYIIDIIYDCVRIERVMRVYVRARWRWNSPEYWNVEIWKLLWCRVIYPLSCQLKRVHLLDGCQELLACVPIISAIARPEHLTLYIVSSHSLSNTQIVYHSQPIDLHAQLHSQQIH